ncbi:MAG: helix-turn-helix transcriptional regulator [Lachnospiraceae bacterium]|nr:helix-turn-helix transcriptional regulator [Lachnospiraceae bacterium]
MAEKFEYSDLLDHRYECFTGDYSKGFSFGLHWHYFMEILLINTGELELQIGNSSVIAKSGDLVVLLPSVMHSITVISDSARYYGIKFKPGNLYDQQSTGEMKWNEMSLFKMAVSDKNVRAHFPSKMIRRTDILYLMGMAIKEMDEKKPGYVSNISAAVQIILTDIIRIWQSEGLSPDNLSAGADEALSLESLPAYIDENIAEELKVSELAAVCHLSYTGFSEKFRKMFGRSCRQYIEYMRVRKAAQLLRDTSDDLSTIAQETGFADASHMIRCFRKEYGETPKKYRDRK